MTDSDPGVPKASGFGSTTRPSGVGKMYGLALFGVIYLFTVHTLR
jgi:hypothetical protein